MLHEGLCINEATSMPIGVLHRVQDHTQKEERSWDHAAQRG